MEAVSEALHRVRRPEEVAAVAHLVVRAERQGLLVDVDRGELLEQRLQHVDVDDQLLKRCDEATLEPAAAVHVQIGASEEGGLHRIHALPGRLRIRQGARRQRPTTCAPRQAVATCHLARREQTEVRFGPPEGRRAVLQIRRRQERAEHGRAARTDQLHQRNARQRFGELLHQCRRNARRCHRSHQQEWHHEHGLAGACVDQQRVEHALVVDQRRVDVDVGVRARLAIDAVAEDDAGRGQSVVHRIHADGVGAEGLVSQRQQRTDLVEMARVKREVIRLDRQAACRVVLIDRLREPAEVLVIAKLAVSALHPAPHERRALHRHEHHVVATEAHVPLRIAGVQGELAGRLRDHLQHPRGIEPDDVAVDRLAGVCKQSQCLWVIEANADLRYEAHPAAFDRGEPIGCHRLEQWEAIDEHR